MANREKTHTFSQIIGTNRLVRTSFKHTRQTTLQPTFQEHEVLFLNFRKELESTNNLFFHDLTESTNKLNELFYQLRAKKKERNKEKLTEIEQLRNELRSINKSSIIKARLSL
ncbi:hypothetical protein SteCoe_33016 [Stentor coeruleus]|uniref:Uncharacterized protein n=1 Tax=Stentor coeruleus TaxID=5963 RepID=A0A1R2AXX3_9CILI|nr:hypothetical protein SteCoe_33016 [Stentor coeruleus]